MLRETLLVFAVLFVLASATQVSKCNNGGSSVGADQVEISGCDNPPCKLKRKTEISIEQKFVPERDVNQVVTSVQANILGVPLPFIGVDGTSACDNIYNADGSKSGCSLKKGVEYLYKNSFPVLQVYPTVSMVIHYALRDTSGDIACFEVPAKITN